MRTRSIPVPASSGRFTLPAYFALGCVLLTSALNAETVDRVERTLDVREGGKLVVDISRANIDVTTSAEPHVSIDYERKIRAGSEEEEKQYLADHAVTIEQDGDTVIIREKKPKKDSFFSGWSWRGKKFEGRCTVVVPSEFNLDLDTSGGSISAVNLTGEVRADTSGGSIRCENITGPVDADTSGGSITFQSVHGKAVADTSGGSITVSDSAGELLADTSGGSIRISRHRGDVDADTSGGSITIDEVDGNVSADTSGGSIRATLLAAPSKDCRLSTSGGGITVVLPRNSAVELNASTSGGRVESDFTVAGVDMRKKTNSMHGDINGGGPLLHLRTSGGSIHVKEGSS